MALPAAAIDAQANAESNNQDYTPSGAPVVSPVGAMYAMQVMPNTASDPGFGVTPAQNNSPQEYDRVGKDYINALTQHYGDYPTALAAYNWGPGNVDKYGVDAAPPETKNYVQKILSTVGNAIIPSAEAAETQPAQGAAPDPASMTLQELEAEQTQTSGNPTVDANGGVAIPQGKSSLKWDPSGAPYRTDVPVTPTPPTPALAPDPSQMTLQELEAEQADPAKTAMPMNAAQSLRAGGLSGLAAHETAMGANAISQVPGLKEAGSAIAAGLGAGQGDSFLARYNNLEDAQEAMRNAGTQADPTATALAKIGGFAGGAGLGGSLVSEIAPGATGAFGKFAQAHPYLASVVAGPPVGAAYGFGDGTGADSRLANAASGAAGAALTAPLGLLALRKIIAPIAGKLASVGGSALEKLADRYNASPIVSGAGYTPAGITAQTPIATPVADKAEDILKEALSNDNINPNDVADNLEKAQATGLPVRAVDVMSKDVGGVPVAGKNMQGLLVATSRMPGKGASQAGEMAARSYKLRDHMGQVFDDLIGGNDYYGMANVADEEGKAASPLYQTAFKENQNMSSPKIDRILATPAGKKALAGARESMLNEMDKMGVVDPELTEQAKDVGMQLEDGGVSTGLKLRTLDYVKQELDAQVRQMKRAADMGNASTRDWTRLNDLAKSLRAEMDKLDVTASKGKPGLYAQARMQAATKPQMQDALEDGRSFMQKDPEEIESFMKDPNTSGPEKMAYATGARRAVQDMMAKNPNGIMRQWKEIIRPRLQYLASSPQALSEADNKIDLLQRMGQNNNYASMAGNSITMPAQQFANKIEEGASSPAGKIAHAFVDPQSAAANAMKELFDKGMQKRAGKITSDVAGEISRYLTSADPALWRSLGKVGPTAASKAAGMVGGGAVAGMGATKATQQYQ